MPAMPTAYSACGMFRSRTVSSTAIRPMLTPLRTSEYPSGSLVGPVWVVMISSEPRPAGPDSVGRPGSTGSLEHAARARVQRAGRKRYRFLVFEAFFTLTFLTALTERTDFVFARALARCAFSRSAARSSRFCCAA